MQELLDERLLEWEERQRRGEAVTADDLCADWPEGRDELVRRIRLLQRFAVLAASDATPITMRVPGSVAKYEIREELGHGGMGVVYRAWDPDLTRDVAIKMMAPAVLIFSGDPARVERRFRQEAKVLAKLKHPNIVPIYESGMDAGRPYFVMELVPGGSLAGKTGAKLGGPSAVIAFVEKVARAVAYAHAAGVLHRDLKPGNILLDDGGAPKVSDFGLAKLLADEAEDAPAPAVKSEGDTGGTTSALTVGGFQPGTPAYMAPEQFNPAFGQVGPATDVWALGVILFELLTGSRPFPGRTRDEIKPAVLHAPTPRHAQLRRGLDGRVEAVVRRCLEKDPQRRYPSAAALAEALRRCRTPRWLLRAAAGAGLIGVLTVVASVVQPDTDLDRIFERAVARAHTGLRTGMATDLLSPGDALPPYRVRCGEGTVNVQKTKDGLTISAPIVGMVELAHNIPSERYRIVAEVRHDHSRFRPQGYKGIGIGFQARHVPSLDGTHHVVQAVVLDDHEQSVRKLPDGSDALCRIATLQQIWYLEAPENGQFPFDSRQHFVETPAHYAPDAPGTWRVVTIDVGPEEVTADFGTLTPQRIGPLRAYMDAFFRRWLAEQLPGVRGISGLPPSRRVVTLIVAGGQCTVRRLQIVPRSSVSP